MAAPRMKPPVKKKTTVKKPKVGTVKSPEETRKSISRKQVGTSRPARGLTPEGAKARALTGMKQPGRSLTVTNRGGKGPAPGRSLTTTGNKALTKTGGNEVAKKARTAIQKTAKNAVGFAERWIPNAMKPKGGGMGLINKAGGVATAVASIVSPSFMSEKTGGQANYGEKEAVAKGLGPLMKGNKKYATKIGPQRPTARKPAPSSNYQGKPSTYSGYGNFNVPKTKKSDGNTSKVGGPGGARAYENVKDKKSSSASTAATSAATSAAASTGAAKKSVRPPTRYQRDELAMEQRKRSSSGQRKSILSLFRKG